MIPKCHSNYYDGSLTINEQDSLAKKIDGNTGRRKFLVPQTPLTLLSSFSSSLFSSSFFWSSGSRENQNWQLWTTVSCFFQELYRTLLLLLPFPLLLVLLLLLLLGHFALCKRKKDCSHTFICKNVYLRKIKSR